MKNIIYLAIFLLYPGLSGFSIPAYPDPPDEKLVSPDGHLTCIIKSENDQLFLSVSRDGITFLEKSPLVMKIDKNVITSGFESGKIRKYKEDETYPLFGLHSVARNNFNGSSIEFTHTGSSIKYSLEIRLFNDAAAFRFLVPASNKTVREPDESTVFTLPAGSTVWYHDLYMHYEGVHERKMVDTIPQGEWAAPPLTVKIPGGYGYLSVTEADLVGYAGMALQSDGRNGFAMRLGHSHPASYPYVLRYKKEDIERLSKIAKVEGPITTPWRVIIVGKDLNTLVNSDVVYNLCPPPDKKLFPDGIKADWIRPGRAVWKYLDGGGEGTLTVMKEFSRLAGELGFEYNILEGFWSRWPDDSIKALVDYSRKLGVGIIVWKHSNTLYDQKSRLELFQKCKDLGIAGLKIDFFDHEAREVVDLYEAILKETAAFRLICIFHGANKPTGLWRTWPNAMIYEAVKGMEASKLLDRASHETTIPFTRMLAGPADYSVCHFGTRRQNTTWVHQVATSAIFSAPLITYAATPAHILENPCCEMIRSIPSVWDETIVLPPSEIGELAIYAQRKGPIWFLSVINGLHSVTIKVPLDFLGKGTYNTLVLTDDGNDPESVKIIRKVTQSEEQLDIDLLPGGGYITRFELN